MLRLCRKLTVQEEIPSAFLEELYDKIVKNEIKMEVDGVMFGSAEKKVRKFSSLSHCPGCTHSLTLRWYMIFVAQGWLIKQGGRIPTWKRRYFILTHN